MARPDHAIDAPPDPVIEARLDQVLTHLYSLYHTEIDLSLERTYRFLERLGNPHLRLPPVVHVAGTNGKGSTVATLRALLEASVQKVHVYTSPHLVHPTERIRLAGDLISPEGLLNLLTECIEINANEPITFFELFTCAALLAFSRVPADWVILETGMGGRLDPTNVVPRPAATVITMISRDHTAFLGDSLLAIAGEKAGIIKPGVPCIIGRQTEEATRAGVERVFHDRSQALSPEARLVRFGAEWSSAPEAGRMMFRYGNDSIMLPLPGLPGNHQVWNAGAALAALRIIAPAHFKPEILSTGLADIDWPGRLQTLKNHPYNDLIPPGWDIVIDGGHNDSAGAILAEQAISWQKADGKPLHLVLAMVNRKNPMEFLSPLLPHLASLTLTRSKMNPPSFSVQDLTQIVSDARILKHYNALNSKQAVLNIVNREVTPPASRILLTGSLYFVGEILKNA